MDSKTQLIGLIGQPIAHSKSPIMHNEMFKALNLNLRYAAFNVNSSQLKKAIEGVRALDIKGLNVTIPHKIAVMQYLDELSEEAEAIGAVNTIVNVDGRLIGYNTDGEGYILSLLEETKITLKGKKVVILGAGGAAKAISFAFTKHPIAEIIIVNRNLQKAQEIVNLLKKQANARCGTYEQLKDWIEKVDIIVNTTSIGMYPNINELVIDEHLILPHHIVSDIIYNPLETELLKKAKQRNASVHSGLGMFIYQGVLAFEKWTGLKGDPDLMKRVVLNELRNIKD